MENKRFDPKAKMTSSTSLSDWLGTAATNAEAAAKLLLNARQDGRRATVDRAEELLRQAMADLCSIQCELLKTL